ncbi:phosphatase PAP2 family protein [Dactylosporangium sp. NPDC049525]|uniref:phosphatase PAP2 family protein n=1 Tax=Dactylosporangium sp. NPDC049525 TaxID=3154730 RepID=UPI00343F79B0
MEVAKVNYQLFQLINDRAGRVDGLDDVMEFAADRLIYGVFAGFAAIVVWALLRRRLEAVAKVFAALLLAFAGAQLLSHLNGQPRPFQTHRVHQLIAHAPGVSLPSDHATAAFGIALAVGVFLHRGWGMVLLVAAAALGLARIWVGVHYPGDIAAALLVAVAAVAVVAHTPFATFVRKST